MQYLGWLYNNKNAEFENKDTAVKYLTLSISAGIFITKSDKKDGKTWYLLGRCYMSQKKFTDAYNAYQQAVYFYFNSRFWDGRNPMYWCSIGLLYFKIRQFNDALDAFSRAIRINPYLSEVWYNLGILYESCENQTSDAIDAYAKCLELDPSNAIVNQRISLLRASKEKLPEVLQPRQPFLNDLLPKTVLKPKLFSVF